MAEEDDRDLKILSEEENDTENKERSESADCE